MIQPLHPHPKVKFMQDKSNIRFCIRKYISLPDKLVKEHLNSYYLLYWDYEYFKSQLKEGTITHQGVLYQVSYYEPLGKLKVQGQVRLSFREPQERYNLLNYVVVSGI